MLIRTLTAFLIVSAIFASNSARGSHRAANTEFGGIRGRVLDPGGQPAAGIIVNARSVAPARGGVFVTKSDDSGNFVFREVPAGRYKIYASKDQTDISFMFFNTAPWTASTIVREGQVTRGTIVRLSKTAKLIGFVLDAATGARLRDARISLCRDDDPRKCFSFSDERFRLLVPSIAYRIKVSAAGYEDWYYGRDGSKEHAEALRLEPNTSKELTIPLRRSK